MKVRSNKFRGLGNKEVYTWEEKKMINWLCNDEFVDETLFARLKGSTSSDITPGTHVVKLRTSHKRHIWTPVNLRQANVQSRQPQIPRLPDQPTSILI